jgi:hypothetical protein
MGGWHENVDFWSTPYESHFMTISAAPASLEETNASALFLQSSLREKVLEHLFVGELLRALWCQGRRDIELLRGEVDSHGYDLVVECDGVLRHMQLKSSFHNARASSVNISLRLAQKPAGCVIWMRFDPATLNLGPFLWLGEGANKPLALDGYRKARHTRWGRDNIRNERPGLVTVRKTAFHRVESMEGLIMLLFGNRSP